MNAIDSDVQLVRERVDRVVANRRQEILDVVHRCLSEVLARDMSDWNDQKSLVECYGAESMDFMDMTFRLEEVFGCDIATERIADVARGGRGEPVAVDGVVSARALARLRVLMPEVDAERFTHTLKTYEIQHLFTTDTLVRLIAWHISDRELTHNDEGV